MVGFMLEFVKSASRAGLHVFLVLARNCVDLFLKHFCIVVVIFFLDFIFRATFVCRTWNGDAF